MLAQIEALPRFRLFADPSPFHRLERLEQALGGRAELWIKREDLLPLAFGGNKLRNLEFLVGAALAAGADTLVTSGRRWSNHCRLTAAAGARAGLEVHLVLSGPPAPGGSAAAGQDAGPPNPGRFLDELLGATVRQLSTPDRDARDAAVREIVDGLRQAGRSPYVIPVGGSGMPGAAGQVLAAAELLAQASAAKAPPDVVVVPSATGGTQAGLLAGLRLGGSTARVHGVLVARTDPELRPAILATLEALGPAAGMVFDAEEVELDGSQLGDGYGRPTPAAEAATGLLARTEGLFVDPIYTAKALAALVGAVGAERWDGQRVVFWHAGGTPGLFEPLEGGSAQ